MHGSRTSITKFFILFVFLFGFIACENDIEEVNLITSFKKIPTESGKNVLIVYSDSARIKMKLKAAQLDHYDGENAYVEFPKGINVFFYNDKNKLESNLKANYAIRYEKSNMMEAKNNVIVINDKGEKLNTEHLYWDEKKELIYSDVFVKITTKDEIIMGEGLESNQNFSKYKFKKIKGTISVKQ
jgi:LPS export ABC transporter protein LptC